MSKSKNTQKRVVKTSKGSGNDTQKRAQSSTRSTTSKSSQETMPLIFNKQNYILMGAGAVTMIIGLLLMSGGGAEMGAPFNADEIYSFRRITLAPFIMIVGLLIEVYAIFKK